MVLLPAHGLIWFENIFIHKIQRLMFLLLRLVYRVHIHSSEAGGTPDFSSLHAPIVFSRQSAFFFWLGPLDESLRPALLSLPLSKERLGGVKRSWNLFFISLYSTQPHLISP